MRSLRSNTVNNTKMKKTEKKFSLIGWLMSHKKTVVFVLILLIIGLYYGYKKYTEVPAVTKYVLSTVKKGTVAETVTGTGQVAASNQVDVSSKTSGDVVSVNVSVGQEVKAGTVIARLDARDAAFELENARIAYDDLVTIDPVELSKAENTYKNANDTLITSYSDARAVLAQASIDMRDANEGIATLYDKDGYLNVGMYTSRDIGYPYREKGERSFDTGTDILKYFFLRYGNITKDTSVSEIDSMLNDAYNTAKNVFEASKDTKDAVAFIRDRAQNQTTIADNALATANDMTTLSSSVVDSLLSIKDTIEKNKRALSDAKSSLEKLKKGPDLTDIRSSQLSIRQKEKAYQDYIITAPFDGIVAKLNVKKADSVNNGTVIATLITKQQIAEISLNEIDAAKVFVGQGAQITFDALPGVEIAGKVSEFDLVGTVSQGVVSYSMKISFDSTGDVRIRPGMSVSAVITTASKNDVLVVSSSAIKSQNKKSYVEIVDVGSVFNSSVSGLKTVRKQRNASSTENVSNVNVPGQNNQGIELTTPPTLVQVVVGLIGDDFTEIVSGLNEGQMYVTKTIAPTASTVKTAPNIFSAAGATGGANRTGSTGGTGAGGGNATRMLR